MKYLQSPNRTNAYGLYDDEIGPGHLVAIIEFEPEQSGEKLIRLFTAAPLMLAALTEGIGIPANADFADDLDTIASQLDNRLPVYAEKIREKAQAVRAAIAAVRGGVSGAALYQLPPFASRNHPPANRGFNP